MPAGPTPGADGWIEPYLVSTRGYGSVSLVVDEAGVAHAASVLNDGIFYLTNQAGSWTRERLTRPAGHDWDPVIALDRNGALYIAFTRWPPEDPDYCPPDIADCFGPGPDGVFLVTNASGSWSNPERIGNQGSNSPSLEVRNGAVHLAFLAEWVLGELSGPGRVVYRTNQGGSWTTERLGRAYSPPSLALNDEGLPFIAYWDDDVDYWGEFVGQRLWFAAGATMGGSFELDQLPGPSGDEPEWIERIDLAIGDDGRAHVVASTWADSGDAVHHWVRHEGDWQAAAEITRGAASVLGVAAGVAGGLRLLVMEDQRYLQYITERGGSYTTRTLQPQAARGAVAIDSQGRSHILFTESGEAGSGLWYALGPAD